MPNIIEVIVEGEVTPSKWPKILAAVLGIFIIGVVIVGRITAANNQRVSIAATQTADAYISHPENILSVVRVQSGNSIVPGCPGNCGPQSEFQITNNSPFEVGLSCSQENACGNGDCETTFGWGYEKGIESGESLSIYCRQDKKIKPPEVCLEFHPAGQYSNSLGRWCLDGQSDSFVFTAQ